MIFPGSLGCGPGARAWCPKSIGPVISDCGLRIADFFGFLFQSTFRNRHSAIWWRADRALGNSEFGMWNSEFFASFFAILHSALCIPHLKCPPGPRNEERLGFCTQRPCPRAGHPTEATFGWCPFIIRSERCTHFQAIGSAGLISFLINNFNWLINCEGLFVVSYRMIIFFDFSACLSDVYVISFIRLHDDLIIKQDGPSYP